MKKLFIISILLCFLIACNDDVFIKPMKVEPMEHTLDWTGGSVEFTSNQDIDYVSAIIYRCVNGKISPVDNRTIEYTLDNKNQRVKIINELCDLTLFKNDDEKLVIESGYNLFPDTISMNINISSFYETVSRTVSIMPSPGFRHGEISYNLNQCWYEEHVDTTMLLHAAMFGEARDFVVKEKGSVLAHSVAQFRPYDKLLSDNIFGRVTFDVDEVIVKGWNWELSDKKIPYKSSYQPISGDSIVFNEDLVVTLQPNTEYRIKAVVNSEQRGFNYTLPAISPVEGLHDRIIEGEFWIVTPVSYEILIETNDIGKP